MIAVSLLDSLLRFRIRTEVSKNEVLVGRAVVVREQRIVDRSEQLRITVKCTVHELDQDLADIRVIVENVIRAITAVMLKIDDLIRGQTEDERVLLADFLYDLNVRAVHGSERRSAVQHELHISGTGRLLGCCRDLLGYIRCSENDLAVGDLVILDEDDLQLVVKGRIIVDGLCDRVDQLDDQLRDLIACRCFRTENECSRIELHSRILEQLIPEVHDVQDIQELSLVLMQTLDLNVEDRVRIDIHAVMLVDIVRKALLVAQLNAHELLLRLLVVDEETKLRNLGEICDPLLADLVGDPGSKLRIAVEQESSLCDTIRLIAEFLRHHVIEILQNVLLKDLRVKRCNAVDRMAADDREIRHADLTVIDDAHIFELFTPAVRIFLAHFIFKAAVDLLRDLVDTRKKA